MRVLTRKAVSVRFAACRHIGACKGGPRETGQLSKGRLQWQLSSSVRWKHLPANAVWESRSRGIGGVWVVLCGWRRGGDGGDGDVAECVSKAVW